VIVGERHPVCLRRRYSSARSCGVARAANAPRTTLILRLAITQVICMSLLLAI